VAGRDNEIVIWVTLTTCHYLLFIRVDPIYGCMEEANPTALERPSQIEGDLLQALVTHSNPGKGWNENETRLLGKKNNLVFSVIEMLSQLIGRGQPPEGTTDNDDAQFIPPYAAFKPR
jgi:hypothetical protein